MFVFPLFYAILPWIPKYPPKPASSNSFACFFLIKIKNNLTYKAILEALKMLLFF